MWVTVATLAVFSLNILAFLALFIRSRKRRNIRSYAFFHPYCNAGGGGERVLWTALLSVQERFPDIKCVVYTGDTKASPDEIIQTARRRFSVELLGPVQFVYLRTRGLVEAKYYPRLTLILQSVGSMILALEAMLKFTPDVFIDTMGYAFTLPVAKLMSGCQTVSYVHYPTVSTDMLQAVESGRASFNNSSRIASNSLMTQIKVVYYKMFASVYGFVGSVFGDVTMVNSSWTKGHIDEIWSIESHLIYPPCSVEDFQQLNSLAKPSEEFRIVSLAQFRPEKDHMLQLQVMKELQKLIPESFNKVKLILVGSCRNSEDEQRIDDLKIQAKYLGIADHVEFRIDVKYADLKIEMQKASAAVHTMWNEHFGIAVVECLAAGLITVAHNSGGPKMDIVRPGCGYLAKTAEQYAKAFKDIIELSSAERLSIIKSAKASMERFTEARFKAKFVEVFEVQVECLLKED